MNGIYVAEVMREFPSDSLTIQPYPDGRSVWDYMHAVEAERQLGGAADGHEAATILTRHIFGRHPFILDLPPAVLHRYRQSRQYMDSFPNGQAQLTDSILGHFTDAELLLQQGYANMQTVSIGGMAVSTPKPGTANGEWVQRVALPESMQRRSLVWNRWTQGQIKDGKIDQLFSTHPQWHGIKTAEGSLLPAGNLNIELVEGLARTKYDLRTYAEETWQLPIGDKWGSGLELWFAMTHIIEKDLLKFASTLGPDMIDGMHLTPDVYAKAYKPIIELIDRNPQLGIQGALSDGTWAYSRRLAELFPDQHISKLHAIAGNVIELGTAEELHVPEQVRFATGEPRRRAAYEAGQYLVDVAARFITRDEMAQVVWDTLG